MSREESKRKIFSASHELPGKFWLDYILLPYGAFYNKTKQILDAKKGDTLRFFNGPDVKIEKVFLIDCDAVCDFLCRMRYGITWEKAFAVWLRYARMEGHDKTILSTTQCILVTYNAEDTE